jgi:hypothetical protein
MTPSLESLKQTDFDELVTGLNSRATFNAAKLRRERTSFVPNKATRLQKALIFPADFLFFPEKSTQYRFAGPARLRL